MNTLLTRYLIAFMASAAVLTIIFRYFLSNGIENHNNIQITVSSIFYAGTMYWIGYLFGKKERANVPWHTISFRWNLSTYLIHMAISLFWFQNEFNASNESISVIYTYGLIWGVILFCHYLFYNSYQKI